MLKTHKLLKPFAFLGLFVTCLPALGLNLPVNAEADRLLLAAENAMESNNQHEAKRFLSQAQALNTSLPERFYFLYGTTLFHLDELDKASINLIKFVESADRENPDYKKALGLLTNIEKRNNQHRNSSNKPSTTTAKQPTSLIENTEVQYIKQLKQLYLTNSASDALLKHINEMLASYALKRPEKIIKLGQQPLTRFRLSLDRSGSLITSSQTINMLNNADTKSIIDTTKINVYGVDPFITYRCSLGTNSCWLRSPVNGDRWIEISNNEQAIAEIAKASTALIKLIQKGEV